MSVDEKVSRDLQYCLSWRSRLKVAGWTQPAGMLALIHHLTIANNLPFSHIFEFAHALCSWLIIEYVPKQDQQAQRLLRSREDLLLSDNYSCAAQR